MAALTPEINFDGPGPGRGAGPSGPAGFGTTELAGLRRRSTLGLHRSGPCIRVSEGTGSRPRKRGPALPIRNGHRGSGSRLSCAGRGRTRCWAFAEDLGTARTSLLFIVALLGGQRTCIWLSERGEADLATGLKKGKVAWVVTSMNLGVRTLGLQPAEGTGIFATMYGLREEKVMFVLWCLVF